MKALKSIKTIFCTLALAIASYTSIGVATTAADINQAQASSFSKELKRAHNRQMKATERRFERMQKNFIRDTHKAAAVGIIGVATGGILLSSSDRRKYERMQREHNQRAITQQQQQQHYYYQQQQHHYQQQQRGSQYNQYYLR